jgi:hypothetical protein
VKAIEQTNRANLNKWEDEDTDIEVANETAVAAITRSEIEAQLDAAHKYPRSIGKFGVTATKLATYSQAIAESCMYSVPRSGKTISGPSVRLAEIVASCYGNLHYGSRIVDADDTHVTAQGVAWDLEKNLRVTVEVKRRITDRNGRRFNDDMVTVTGNAAASIAVRNAIFRVVPRAYVDTIYEDAKQLVTGDAKSFVARRDDFLVRLLKLGVSQERVLARLGKPTVSDMEPDDLTTLVGLGNAVRSGAVSLDEAFPEPNSGAVPAAPLEAGQDGRRMSMKRAPKGATGDAEREPGSDG